jgi:hypothetical protein
MVEGIIEGFGQANKKEAEPFVAVPQLFER